MVTSSKTTANDTITSGLDIKVVIQGVTTQTTIMITIIRVVTATDVAITIIDLVTTTIIVITIVITVVTANSIIATATVNIYITNATNVTIVTSCLLARPGCMVRDCQGAASK
jgi:hypothetical protein